MAFSSVLGWWMAMAVGRSSPERSQPEKVTLKPGSSGSLTSSTREKSLVDDAGQVGHAAAELGQGTAALLAADRALEVPVDHHPWSLLVLMPQWLAVRK